MKSAMTPQCKICMVERKEICHRFRENKSKIINDNSDVFSSCKCRTKFHKFDRDLINVTLRKRSTQKKVKSTRHSKSKRKRFSFDREPSTPSSHKSFCSPCTTEETPITPEPAPVFLHDIAARINNQIARGSPLSRMDRDIQIQLAIEAEAQNGEEEILVV